MIGRMCALTAIGLWAGGCGDADDVTQPTSHLKPVVINANVNVQLGNTVIGQRPAYTVTAFASAMQGGVKISPTMDSIILSYRLNDSPFVVGSALRRTPFAGELPFIVQTGDRYTMYARMYTSASGVGGVKGMAISDWNISGVAVAAASFTSAR